MYQALYRKYRPQTFDDVVGQQAVSQTLKTQLLSNRLSHAYLFTGSSGAGKQIGMTQPATEQLRLQCLGYSRLPHQIVKGLGTVFAVQGLIHRRPPF